MTTAQKILDAIKTIVGIRNDLQSAIDAGAHILPATAAVPAAGTVPAVPAAPAQPTGHLINAQGQAHNLAVQLKNHLAAIAAGAESLEQAADLIANVDLSAAAPEAAKEQTLASGQATLEGGKPLPPLTEENAGEEKTAPGTDTAEEK
ncbi:MAG TPA: hypothetical protein VG347_03510 [Verrucomicrobiae bacterium]|nr:hypothetical protein [Verrucomicrobiae bacterium]